MIRRVILLQLQPEHQATRAQLGQRIQALLISRPMVAGAEVSVWQPSLEPDHPGWDLVVNVDFADSEALEAYGADQVHADFVRQVLAPFVRARQAFVLQRLAASVQS